MKSIFTKLLSSAVLALLALFFIMPNAKAQTVSDFNSFIAITSVTSNYNVSLNGDILLLMNSFNILTGTITANGHIFDGQLQGGFNRGGDITFLDNVTFQNMRRGALFGGQYYGGAFYGGGYDSAKFGRVLHKHAARAGFVDFFYRAARVNIYNISALRCGQFGGVGYNFWLAAEDLH